MENHDSYRGETAFYWSRRLAHRSSVLIRQRFLLSILMQHVQPTLLSLTV